MTQLTDALRNLDPAEDKHWTSDGAPAVEVVRELAADATVNRKAITDAAPDLTRTTFPEWLAKLDEPDAPEPELEPQAVDYQAEVDRLLDLEAKITRDISAKQRELKQTTDALALAIDARDKANPPPTAMESIMHHVQSQHAERMKRAGIVENAPPTVAAPIDAAFNYRRHQQGINNGFKAQTPTSTAAKPGS